MAQPYYLRLFRLVPLNQHQSILDYFDSLKVAPSRVDHIIHIILLSDNDMGFLASSRGMRLLVFPTVKSEVPINSIHHSIKNGVSLLRSHHFREDIS